MGNAMVNTGCSMYNSEYWTIIAMVHCGCELRLMMTVDDFFCKNDKCTMLGDFVFPQVFVVHSCGYGQTWSGRYFPIVMW